MTIDQLITKIKSSSQHKYLYHFTDETNFESIGQKGLVCKSLMRTENWWPNATGGNELSHQLDDRRGISDYVSLCFTRSHPMKYTAQKAERLVTPRYLAISPEVLRIPNSKIAFGVANSNDVTILSVVDALEHLDVEVLYTRTAWSDPEIQARLKSAEKLELLIPHCVPRDMIVGAY